MRLACDIAGPTLARLPFGIAGRWILYAGLALLFGWSISALVVFAGRSPSPSWVLLACWLAGGLALITIAEATSIDASVGQLLGASAGARLVRTGTLLAALAVGVGVAFARLGRVTAAGTAVLAAATMFSHVSAGHAGAPGSTQWLNLASQWLHFVFIGAWIGGLVWLLARTRGRPDDERLAESAGSQHLRRSRQRSSLSPARFERSMPSDWTASTRW